MLLGATLADLTHDSTSLAKAPIVRSAPRGPLNTLNFLWTWAATFSMPAPLACSARLREVFYENGAPRSRGYCRPPARRGSRAADTDQPSATIEKVVPWT